MFMDNHNELVRARKLLENNGYTVKRKILTETEKKVNNKRIDLYFDDGSVLNFTGNIDSCSMIYEIFADLFDIKGISPTEFKCKGECKNKQYID